MDNTHAQHIGGGFHYPFGYLKLTMALHGSALPDGSNGGNPVGFLLTSTDGKKIYMAGDTGLFGDMRLLGEEGLDVAVLPIGYNYTMGPDDALRSVKLLAPKHVIPIHFGTWALIDQNPQEWAARVAKETEAQIDRLANRDPLTDLPNRTAVMQSIQRAITRSQHIRLPENVASMKNASRAHRLRR